MLQRSTIEQWVRSLNENDFRIKILIPVFKAMKYNNVTNYHGGSKELGKDIVMWKMSDFQKRENYAVVVKTGKITGSVTGKGSFSEIVIQVQQAFGSKYTDETTLEEASIDHCIIVTNTETTKETIDALKTTLNEYIKNHNITFFNFNTLIDYLVTFNIGPNTIESMISFIDSQDPKGKIKQVVISREKEQKNVHVMFSNDVPQSDLVGEFAFSFPNTTIGNMYKQKMQELIDFGRSVDIPKEFIKSYKLPKIIEDISQSSGIEYITIGTPENEGKANKLSFFIEKKSGEISKIENLLLKTKDVGRKAFTLVCDEDDRPFIIEIVVSKDNKVTINYTNKSDTSKFPVSQLYESLLFISSIQNDSILKVIESNTGIEVFKTKYANIKVNHNYSQLLEIYMRCSYIQRSMKKTLFIPSDGLSKQDIKDIYELYTIIHDGKREIKNGTFSFTLKGLDAKKQLIDNEDTNSSLLKISVNHNYEILGNVFDIGIVEYIISKGKTEYEETEDGNLSIKIHIIEGAPAIAFYKKFSKDK